MREITLRELSGILDKIYDMDPDFLVSLKDNHLCVMSGEIAHADDAFLRQLGLRKTEVDDIWYLELP